MKKKLCALLTSVIALTTSGCSFLPSRNTPPAPQERVANLQVRPGPPLPEGSVLRSAGSLTPPRSSTQELVGSYRPDDRSPAERVPDIVKRGRVIVGVDRSNNLLSYRDTASGEVRGFEVDIAHEIARDIFGDPNRVDFRFVESSERTQALNEGTVDLIVRTMTITPEREREVSFSTPYLTTNTRTLVLSSSGINSMEDTAVRTLCAVQGSTALGAIAEHAPRANVLETVSWGDCLMALQLNQTDGIVVDDAVLSGMLAQDAYTSIVGESLKTENYGIAMRRNSEKYDARPLVRQVNSTLERIQRDGTWNRIYNQWLGAYLPQPTLPAPRYIDESPQERGDEAAKKPATDAPEEN
ncbi:glutamate ABC transporter substrate-binding protein [Corynebacterium flavescens]|uniref:glutamate ABC transporter substrate-binding protein n=1 Tax=Corynebacterium flavescens TaxID=28028 RepID=UPI00289FC05A|nr:glutamate ABC transporter substrate-binding protein [Corynebacterium flavescens]